MGIGRWPAYLSPFMPFRAWSGRKTHARTPPHLSLQNSSFECVQRPQAAQCTLCENWVGNATREMRRKRREAADAMLQRTVRVCNSCCSFSSEQACVAEITRARVGECTRGPSPPLPPPPSTLLFIVGRCLDLSTILIDRNHRICVSRLVERATEKDILPARSFR